MPLIFKSYKNFGLDFFVPNNGHSPDRATVSVYIVGTLPPTTTIAVLIVVEYTHMQAVADEPLWTVNHSKLMETALSLEGVDVTLANVYLGLKVRRGRHWRRHWRDDIDKRSKLHPKPRLYGHVIGYTDAGGSEGEIHLLEDNGPGWAVVAWDTGKVAPYPIGAEGLYSLHAVCA